MRIVLFLLIFYLSGCATAIEPVTSQDNLPHGYGYVVTRFHNDWKRLATPQPPQVHYLFYHEQQSTKNLKFLAGNDEQIQVIALPAGEYRWRHVLCEDYLLALDNDYVFKVVPDKITYIGDVYAGLELRRFMFLADFAIADNSEAARHSLVKRFPKMLKQHEFLSTLTKIDRQK